MRPALSCKVGPSGISVSDQKLGDNPGPGKPYLNRFGGGYMGDGPTHKIGTGVKLPNPAENLKKRVASLRSSAALSSLLGLPFPLCLACPSLRAS